MPVSGDPGWSFTAAPVQGVQSTAVSYAFQGPATPHSIEARVYGYRIAVGTNGAETRTPYFADSDPFSPYDGSEQALSQSLASGVDRLASVAIYDLTDARTLLLFIPEGGESGWPLSERDSLVGRVRAANTYVVGEEERLFDYAFRAESQISVSDFTLVHPTGRMFGWINWDRPGGAVAGRVRLAAPTAPGEVRRIRQARRQWGGIGGFQNKPSYPQLDRRRTTWPRAR